LAIKHNWGRQLRYSSMGAMAGWGVRLSDLRCPVIPPDSPVAGVVKIAGELLGNSGQSREITGFYQG
jgi:hypothetical protein